MPFEEEFQKKKHLELAKDKPNIVSGFELPEEEIGRIDLLLEKMKNQEKIQFKQYQEIMPDLKNLFYKIKDGRITDHWIETINNFKDQDVASAILMGIEKYKQAAA